MLNRFAMDSKWNKILYLTRRSGILTVKTREKKDFIVEPCSSVNPRCPPFLFSFLIVRSQALSSSYSLLTVLSFTVVPSGTVFWNANSLWIFLCNCCFLLQHFNRYVFSNTLLPLSLNMSPGIILFNKLIIIMCFELTMARFGQWETL